MSGKTKPPYAAQFRQQIVALYANGRRIADLAKEFGPSKESIAAWVARAGVLPALPDKGAGVRRTHARAVAVAQSTALSSQERTELEQLRRDVRRLQTERDILSNRLRGAPRPCGEKLGAPILMRRSDLSPLAFWRHTTP